MTRLFLSYSIRDRDALDSVLSALRHAREDVWFDEELGGGEVWWRTICKRIRECEVFVFAMSDSSLRSKPCLAELRYAQALDKPVLPVRIGPVQSMRVTPLAAVEAIDYQNPTVDSGIALITAVAEARSRCGPLPTPLPDEPPVPFAYLMRLANTIADADLSSRDQVLLVSELKSGLDEDGDDPAARRDITRMLTALRDRPDVTYRTRTDIEALLGPDHAYQRPPSRTPLATPQPATSRKPDRIWAIAGAAAAIAVIAVIAALVTTSNPQPAQSSGPPAADTPAQRNSPAEANPDATVTFDGRRLPTTGRPMCVTTNGKLSIMIAAPDLVSQVLVTLRNDSVEYVGIPVGNESFMFNRGPGRAVATKTGDVWTITGEIETGSGGGSPKPFSIDVACR